ncbi:MAG: hypothetical protein J6Q61_09725 [Bacteroidales bacterium]|nr:hypothetical protein [Bacteroidales bacterium]
MKIETKYNIGDEVWFKGYEEIFNDKITNIRIDVDIMCNTNIMYILWDDTIKYEHQLFRTKQELLDSL